MCDARGNPLRLILTPGKVSDSTQAVFLLDGIKAGNVHGDKAYDSDAMMPSLPVSK